MIAYIGVSIQYFCLLIIWRFIYSKWANNHLKNQVKIQFIKHDKQLIGLNYNQISEVLLGGDLNQSIIH